MKSIQQYINEHYQINESFVIAGLWCLCAAAALHFGVKLTRKIANVCDDFWGWAVGDKEITMQTARESLNESNITKEDKFDKSKVQPMQIPDEKILDKVIAISEPKGGKNKKGFYYFNTLLKEQPELKKLNKQPYYPIYVAFMDAGSEDKPEERPNFYGLVGFSMKYWGLQIKKGKTNEIKQFAKQHSKYMHIFAVQTDPKFAKLGLLDVYIENLKKACTINKLNGITIHCVDDELRKVYERYKFVMSDLDNEYMVLTLNDKKK